MVTAIKVHNASKQAILDNASSLTQFPLTTITDSTPINRKMSQSQSTTMVLTSFGVVSLVEEQIVTRLLARLLIVEVETRDVKPVRDYSNQLHKLNSHCWRMLLTIMMLKSSMVWTSQSQWNQLMPNLEAHLTHIDVESLVLQVPVPGTLTHPLMTMSGLLLEEVDVAVTVNAGVKNVVSVGTLAMLISSRRLVETN